MNLKDLKDAAVAPFALEKWSPGALAAVLLGEFVLLIYLFMAWQHEWIGIKQSTWPALIGAFPIVVPWAGGAGGVTAGLVGLSAHWSDFSGDPSDDRDHQRREWNAWYLLRLPLGMALGSVGALIVVLVTATLGTTGSGDPDVSSTGQLLLAVVAFAIGFRQHSFQELLTRLFDVILGTEQKAAAGTTTDFTIGPHELAFAATSVGATAVKAVKVTNNGPALLKLAARSVTIAGDDADQFTIAGRPAGLARGRSGDLKVRYHPREAGKHKATLEVSVADAMQSVALTGEAT